MTPFKVGDIVRLQRGWTALQVVAVSSRGLIFACYSPDSVRAFNESGGGADKIRPAGAFVLWDRETVTEAPHGQPLNRFENPEGDTLMSSLYTWKTADGEALFGTKIAVNSAGQWVMEVKGTSQVCVIGASDAEVVLPYSVAVQFMDSDQVYHYWADKASGLEVGDRILMGRGVACVVRVDTKSSRANKWVEGFKLTGVALVAPTE